jgi:murein L,D-transpeptidase YafK
VNRSFKIIALLLFLIVAGAVVVSIVAPHLIESAKDRVGRNVPELGRIVKPAPPRPLAERLAAKGLAFGRPVFIRIMKESSELELWMADAANRWVLFETYPICRWSGALGPKLKEGDGQSPEGFYAVSRRAMNPNSSYHLAFNLGFPNTFDRSHGRTGSFLMVHGDCVSIGCYAMTDRLIEEIYGLADAAQRNGQTEVPVHVFPFRMTEANLARHQAHRDAPFWINLKRGWDWFEVNARPPQAWACAKRYAFGDASPGQGCEMVRGM